jgi:hypothetical protein
MGKAELTVMSMSSIPKDRCNRIVFIAPPKNMDELAATVAKIPFISTVSPRFDPLKCLSMATGGPI